MPGRIYGSHEQGVLKLPRFIVIVFIDDILVYSKNEGKHMDHLSVVLQVLKENQLFTKYKKCMFQLRSVAFLGHMMSSEGVDVDPRKTEVAKIGLDH